MKTKKSQLPKQTTPKKLTQKDKQERGQEGEADITASLLKAKLWNYKMVNAGYGTPFDKLIIPPGGGYAVEVKVRLQPRVEYSKIEQNERKGLEKFMRLVGLEHSFIIGIWETEEFSRAFLIPWYKIRDAVCSGTRGSIRMEDFPELPKVAGGWDLSCFKK